ncbi:MAG TPA: hydrogenase maturation protease [Terriglobales bacterium]|nr:hydrogenase maturation protease [Terriglobales bacterium]
MAGNILVAGVGNIFLGDDAFGVEVVQRLAQRELPDHIRVIDFGIRSYDLAYALMEPWDLVILVDAVPMGDEPGTIYTIEPELPSENEPNGSAAFDAHTMNPASVLQMVAALGGKPSRVLLVGCEPANLEPEMDGQIGLSAPVQNAVEEAIRSIEAIISRTSQSQAA